MNIFVSHNAKYDYENELYNPIKSYFKNLNYNFILPEENKQNTKEIIKNADVFFCEISYKCFGVGIEAGWADAFNKPIYCFHKKDTKVSSSFKFLTDKIYEYSSIEELMNIMQKVLSEFKKS